MLNWLFVSITGTKYDGENLHPLSATVVLQTSLALQSIRACKKVIKHYTNVCFSAVVAIAEVD